MKHWKQWAALVALAAMVCAPWAGAQTVTQDGQSARGILQGQWGAGMVDADSTGKVWRATSAGAFQNSDVSRDRNYTIGPTLLRNDTTAIFMADSTQTYLTVNDVIHGNLLFKVEGCWATIRLAVQVREQIGTSFASGDTSNTFPVPPFALTTSDTAKVGGVKAPTQGDVSSYEVPLEIVSSRLSAAQWGFPMAATLPLSRFGFFQPLYATNLTFRWRVMALTGTCASAPRIIVYYVGSPL